MTHCLSESRRERVFLELTHKHLEVSSTRPEPSFMEKGAPWSLSSSRIFNGGREKRCLPHRARTKWALFNIDVAPLESCLWLDGSVMYIRVLGEGQELEGNRKERCNVFIAPMKT